MSYKSLTVDIKNKIAHIKLNRPSQLNSLNTEFWDEFPEALTDINNKAAARVIIISSTGKHFTAGMDLSVFTDDSLLNTEKSARANESLRRTVLKYQETLSLLEKVRMPVLVAIQGGCIGGGVDLISACDSRYCTDDAFFTIEEIKLGMTADLGTLQRLPHLISHGLVRELAYTGRRLLAEEANQSGLINKVFADQESMLSYVYDIAKQIAAHSPMAVSGCKEILNYSRDHSIPDSLNYMSVWQSGMLEADKDMKETFIAKQEQREALFEELHSID